MAGEDAASERAVRPAGPDRLAPSPAPHRASRVSGTPRVSAAECHDEVCVTCADLAVQVTVVRLLGDGIAVVDTGAGAEEVSVALVDARPGDGILVHAKEAIAVVDRAGRERQR